MKQTTLIAVMLLTASLAQAEVFEGRVKLPKKNNKNKERAALVIEGKKFEAVKLALKKCLKVASECAIESISIEGKEAIALTSEVPAGKERTSFKFSSEEIISESKLSIDELHGMAMTTLEKALARCKKYGAAACVLSNAEFTITNDEFYDVDWGGKAYKSHMQINVSAIK